MQALRLGPLGEAFAFADRGRDMSIGASVVDGFIGSADCVVQAQAQPHDEHY